MDAPVTVGSAPEGPPVHPASTRANAPASDPVVPVAAAPAARTPPAPAATLDVDNLHGSLAPSETVDLVEEAVADASLEPDAPESAADRSTPTMLLMTPWPTLKPPICWRKRLRSCRTASSWPT
ncbi:hypothetical protein V6N13_053488 [Hibiscus sabdariffa]